MNWIQEQFGEIPKGVDYSRHILEVLSDIQADNGVYFQSRQTLNRDIRNKQAFIADIAKDIPPNYDAARWESYPTRDKYRELECIRESNSRIERARSFRESFDGKKRGLEANRDMEIAAIRQEISRERENLSNDIVRLQAQIDAVRDRLSRLDDRKKEREELENARYQEAVARLERDMGAADQYAGQEAQDTAALSNELDEAERMRSHLNEYRRMQAMQAELEELAAQSQALTEKIQLARELPAAILAQASIPVEGLTVKDGVPLIHGLPISNLSDGELLELCVDITVSKPGQLGIILVDGAERLDSASRERLYAKCRAKGLQLIATRVTDSAEMEVVEL